MTKPDDLGATGEYPDGKLHEDDEGEIKIAIAADPSNNVVIIDFGKSVNWLGMGKQEALGLADMIRKNAEKLP
jgi:hypothetical protein